MNLQGQCLKQEGSRIIRTTDITKMKKCRSNIKNHFNTLRQEALMMKKMNKYNTKTINKLITVRGDKEDWTRCSPLPWSECSKLSTQCLWEVDMTAISKTGTLQIRNPSSESVNIAKGVEEISNKNSGLQWRSRVKIITIRISKSETQVKTLITKTPDSRMWGQK